MSSAADVLMTLGLILIAALLLQNFTRLSRAIKSVSSENKAELTHALRELRLGSALAIGSVLLAIPVLYLDRLFSEDVIGTAEAAGSAVILATGVLGLAISRRASRILRKS
jgi:membrane-associated phospholipid phosphatase